MLLLEVRGGIALVDTEHHVTTAVALEDSKFVKVDGMKRNKKQQPALRNGYEIDACMRR
jgi:hypothetical protein